MDNKYENGKIYQIYSPSRPDLVYIGSTINTINDRLYNHVHKYKRYKNDNKDTNNRYITSFKIFDACDDYKIHLILNYSCDTKKELTEMEGKYIRMYGTVNKMIEGRTRKEYRKDCKDKILKTKRQYYNKHKDKICEIHKKYRIDNKEKIRNKKKQYYLKIKEMNQKFICDCGGSYIQTDKNRHINTLKHQKYLNSI